MSFPYHYAMRVCVCIDQYCLQLGALARWHSMRISVPPPHCPFFFSPIMQLYWFSHLSPLHLSPQPGWPLSRQSPCYRLRLAFIRIPAFYMKACLSVFNQIKLNPYKIKVGLRINSGSGGTSAFECNRRLWTILEADNHI